jgi:hypothetical protein
LLQRMPVRWPFRVLAGIVGFAALFAGAAIILISIAALHTPQYWVTGMALFGLSLVLLSAVFLLIAFTSSLPESLVGSDGQRLRLARRALTVLAADGHAIEAGAPRPHFMGVSAAEANVMPTGESP